MDKCLLAVMDGVQTRAPEKRVVPVPYPYKRGDLRVTGARPGDYDGAWQPDAYNGYVYLRIPDAVLLRMLEAWACLPEPVSVPDSIAGHLAARILAHEADCGDLAFEASERLLIRILMDGGRNVERAVPLLRAAFAERLRRHISLDVLVACVKRLLMIL